jgi:UDP-N-acetylglucosamine 2-epimerase/N-acetylmannosamine kinase
MVRSKLNKKKICVVINSRANYARIKSLLSAIKESKKLELQLILGASSLMDRFGSIYKTITKDGFKINQKVFSIVEGDNLTTMAKSTGLAIIELSNIFENTKPDMVLTVADRFETLATAVAASYMNIPLIHTQGGEITGSIDESVRHAITRLANIHFPATKKSFNNLIKMGEDKKNIFLTGCPSIDLAENVLKNKKNINLSSILNKYSGVGSHNIDLNNYIVIVQHPVTTEYKKVDNQIKETIKAALKLKMSVVWLWPNIDAGNDIISKNLRKIRETGGNINIKFYKNFEPEDFLKILIKSKCIVGNSSVAIRECSYLGIPAVNIGTRQNGREHGKNIINSGFSSEEIYSKIKKQISNKSLNTEKIFGDGKAGINIAKILEKIKITTTQKRLCYK